MDSRKVRSALALTCVLALAALLAFAVGSSRPGASGGADSVASKVLGDNDQAIAGAPNEERSGDLGPAAEEGALRAGPAESVPFEWTQSAIAAWTTTAARSAGGKGSGGWEPIGPSPAIYPGVLNRTGAQYSASGRITALSIGNTCSPGNCRLLVGAAGGGVWRTDKALAGNVQWEFTSEELPTNAVGTIEKDPNDPSGNTLYLGTGEPNASADSEAGLGVFKSTDGGSTWAPIANNAPFLDRSVSTIRIVPGSKDTIYVATTRGVRGVSGSLSAGAVSLKPNAPVWGLYKSTDGGATWTFLFDGGANATDCDTLAKETGGPPCSVRGVIDVELDPQNSNTVYAATYGFGIWRSTAAGAGPWTQIFYPLVDTNPNVPGVQQGDANERTMLAVTSKNHKTRIYVGSGDTGPDAGQIYSQVFRTDDAAAAQGDAAHTGWISLTSSDVTDPHYGSYNYCWQQCWYDNDIVSPAGYPDTVYVLGAYQYGEAGHLSNARGVTVSYTAGDPNPAWRGSAWADLTRDATSSSQPNGIHPDQHELVLNPSNPSQFIEGSDGGLMVSDGKYVDDSSACDTRGFADIKDGPTAAQQLLACKRLLSYVPHQLNDNLNRGLETLQFQTVSVNPQKPLHNLMGGTQDNGTFEWSSAGNGLWWQVMYGDGGQSGFDATDDRIRFNDFTGRATDSNFAGGDPRKWVVVSGPLYARGPERTPDAPNGLQERVGFYPPITQDPVLHGYRYFGQSHVWRTTDNGGDQAYLEATCPEFTTAANDPKCGDYEPLGGPVGRETAGSLAGSTTFGGTKTNATAANNWVSVIERAPSNDHTLWAGTSGGRIFVTDNVNAANAADVVFDRIDTASQPNRYPSGIAVDPADPYHAFVSFTGYNASTPTTPGHLFDVKYNPATHSATWTNLNVESGFADYPITDVAYDSVTGDLYASNDFGVLKGTKTGALAYSWAATSGLPRVEVSSLTIVPSARVLYAATHGRSIWRLMLG